MASLILSRETISVSLKSERWLVVTSRVTPSAATRGRKELRQRSSSKQENERETHEVPLFNVERVIVIGKPAITIPALVHLMDLGIPCFFMTTHGRWRGAVMRDDNLNSARRMRQYRHAMDFQSSHAVEVASAVVAAKLLNSRRALQRLARNRGRLEDPVIIRVLAELKVLAEHAATSRVLDAIRGIEGVGAAAYFDAWASFLNEKFPFVGRNRRPPRDPVNAMLSFGYTLLCGEQEAAIRAHGLDASVGCLHRDTTHTPSLALDLMEPLRVMVDLLVVDLINHGRIDSLEDFTLSEEDGGVYLNESGREAFFAGYEAALSRTFEDPVKGLKTSIRGEIEKQVLVYLKYLERGEKDEFFKLA